MLLFILGLNGMIDAIHRVYTKAKHQVCCVHVTRNIAKKCELKIVQVK
ncbi:MAG: transposase [Virgibacillus sp.]|nr:transposase [Virgibacillus sp.]